MITRLNTHWKSSYNLLCGCCAHVCLCRPAHGFAMFLAQFLCFNSCVMHDNYLLMCLIWLGMFTHDLEAHKVVFRLHKSCAVHTTSLQGLLCLCLVSVTFWPMFLGVMSVYRLVMMSNMISINGPWVWIILYKFMSSKYTRSCVGAGWCAMAVLASFWLLFWGVLGLVFLWFLLVFLCI